MPNPIPSKLLVNDQTDGIGPSRVESCLPAAPLSFTSRSLVSNHIPYHPISSPVLSPCPPLLYNKKAIPAATAPITPFTAFTAPALPEVVVPAAVPVDVPERRRQPSPQSPQPVASCI
ncbi:hypothetical protein DL98DRAFT_112540 [Cadophora sp. DSE1049]|nr:hypothetical protein DL98DRAFT_112540 [Cadophora sp. DSE1049]